MRIIAGEDRGRRLVTPPGNRVRPTSDMVREALFNVLGDINGKSVLDLFAGSGAVALEAMSRGATSAAMVESNNKAIKTIRENMATIYPDAGDAIVLYENDLPPSLSHVSPPDKGFDIIFFDPPYSETAKFLEIMLDDLTAMLHPRGLLIVEAATRDEEKVRGIVDDHAAIDGDTCKRYGDTILCFLQHSGVAHAR